MDTLKGSDRFRQLLMKFDQSKKSTNVGASLDNSIRKSNRTVKKPDKYDSSPYVAKTKQTKSRDEPVRNQIHPERRDISGERRRKSGGNKSREHDFNSSAAGCSRGRQEVDSRKTSGAPRGKSEKRKSKEHTTDENPGGSGSSWGKGQESKEENCRGSSSPRRSAFRLLANENNRMPSTSRQVLQEPAQRRNQDHDGSYMLDHRRKRDLESSYMPARRRQQDYEPSYVAEKRMADMYSESRDVFAKPYPISSNQSRFRSNGYQNHELYESRWQPVVKLADISRARDQPSMYRSKVEMPPAERRPLVDVMKARERESWQHSRMAQPPPDQSKRFEGGFLRPPTPPGIAELARKEESSFVNTVNKFKNFHLFSTIEIIFILNRLENTLINKMSKTLKKTQLAQNVLRTTMMGSVPDESLKSSMIHSWLKSNDSVAPQRWHDDADNRKRRLDTTGNYYAKKMRMAADEDDI